MKQRVSCLWHVCEESCRGDNNMPSDFNGVKTTENVPTGDKRDKLVKITYGFDSDNVVGEGYLSSEVVSLLKVGVRLELGSVVRRMASGEEELVGLTLTPIEVVPQEQKRCKFCHTNVSMEWWKCCPEHFPEGRGLEFSCKACVVRNHPGYFGTGGE